jgi:hypothetical protein
MERGTLLRRLEELGYPLLGKSINANEVLAEVVKSHDARLWQGFPVLLANMIKNNTYDYSAVISFLKKSEDIKKFNRLLIMSFVLFERQNVSFAPGTYLNVMNLRENLSIRENMQNSFRDGKSIYGMEDYLSWDNVKNTFNNYYRNYEDSNIRNYLANKDESDFEFALSQVFSIKQKDLLKKKIRGEKLTKTEREYYSRVVKKKLIALSNSDLHNIALKLTKE